MYNDDDYTYEEGYSADEDDEEDEYLFEDGFFSFDDDTAYDGMPDIPWDITRESPPGEIDEDPSLTFKQDVLDLFLDSFVNKNAIDYAGPIELLYVFRLYKAFAIKAQTDCPKGLYRTAVMASALFDELFPNGTY